MEPSFMLIEPRPDPPNTKRATDVTQMYDVAFSKSLDEHYEVGRTPELIENTIYLRNNTVNCILQIHLSLPSHLTTTHPPAFNIGVNTVDSITVRLNEAVIKLHTSATKAPMLGEISFKITPSNVNGPVYVRTDLPNFSE